MMKAKRSTALVRSEVVVVDKQTKQERHRDAKHKERETSVPKGLGGSTGTIKVSNGITLSMGYQTVRLDIGIELPWPMRPGMIEDARAGFDEAYNFVDDELATQAKELEGLLKDLSKKYAHR